MYKKKKILALIPARGGSKGIKNKNIISVLGKPLIAYTIEAAKNSQYIDYVYVSTDSPKIAKTALSYGASVPFMRDKSLATDTSKTIEAVMFSIQKLQELDMIFDYVIILQPTSPLRTGNEIDEAIESLLNSNYSSLVSVSKVEENPVLIRSMDENHCLIPILKESSTVRRQDFKDYFKVNGAIYINKIEELTLDTSLNDNLYAYIMPKDSSFDIDTPEDLQKLKKFLKKTKGME